MPTRRVAPGDATPAERPIDLERWQTPVSRCGRDDRERLERGIERQLQALRGQALTEPRGHIPRHDPDSGGSAHEDRGDASPRGVADRERPEVEWRRSELRRELPA